MVCRSKPGSPRTHVGLSGSRYTAGMCCVTLVASTRCWCLLVALAIPRNSQTFLVTPQLQRLPVHRQHASLAAICEVEDAAGVSLHADLMPGSYQNVTHN